LISQYGVDPQITSYVDTLNFYIVPVANPDGYEYSRSDISPQDGALMLVVRISDSSKLNLVSSEDNSSTHESKSIKQGTSWTPDPTNNTDNTNLYDHSVLTHVGFLTYGHKTTIAKSSLWDNDFTFFQLTYIIPKVAHRLDFGEKIEVSRFAKKIVGGENVAVEASTLIAISTSIGEVSDSISFRTHLI
uniref:Peptidase M14 carboxypeptidase A domain-containing protein n=1 Tax=Parascaris equorum TaxID=6256 RepID=A0A914RCC9_PAREQ